MTGDTEDLSVQAIGIVRRLVRGAAEQCEGKGITSEDALLGSLYGIYDTASRVHGPIGAVEWLRTGLDVIERQLMGGPQS